MFKFSVLFFVVVSASLSFVGCSPSGGGGNKPVERNGDLDSYSKASCQYKYSEGEAALKLSSPVIDTSYFGKKYDTSLLTAVLKASGSEVVRFAENTGVRFYKTNALTSESCGFLDSLPQAPADLQGVFDGVPAGMIVLGVYLDPGTRGLPSTANEAAIVVRKDASKYVLVHEYMHHLFHSEADSNGMTGDEVQSAFNRVTNEFISAESKILYSKGEDRKAAINEAALKLNLANKLHATVLRLYFLEEMTIETLLGQKYRNGQLDLVDVASIYNGAWYTMKSSERTQPRIDSMRQKITSFKRNYSFELGVSENALLQANLDEYARIEKEMNMLSARAKAYLDREGVSFQGLIASLSHQNLQDGTGCSHGVSEREIAEIVERLTK